MKCPMCGHENALGKRCYKCGESLVPEPAQPPKRDKSLGTRFFGVLAAFWGGIGLLAVSLNDYPIHGAPQAVGYFAGMVILTALLIGGLYTAIRGRTIKR